MERRVLDRPIEAKSALLAEPGVADALVRAAAAVARMDQALTGHPAFLYRTRLTRFVVKRPWMAERLTHGPLAAVLEGLRLRMDHALRIIDRGTILDAARHALQLHGWLTSPEGAVRS